MKSTRVPSSSRPLARVSAAVLTAAGSLALAGFGPAPAAPAAPRPPVTPVHDSAHRAVGSVVAVDRLNPALWLPGTDRAYRIHYVSTGHDGRRHIVTGAAFVPAGPAPVGGWPVVSWAHGTVGSADACTPSILPRTERDADYLGAWPAAGYAVVATDYEGLGTAEEHPYLDGRSEAYSVIDMVRAARRVDPSLGRRWLAVGQSQGAQAALFVGAMERGYGGGLDFRGSIATPPPSQWRTLFEILDPFRPDAPTNPFLPLLLPGMQAATDGRFDIDGYLTEAGEDLVERALTDACVFDLIALAAGTQAGTFFDVDAREQERLVRTIVRRSEIPIRRYSAPAFIGQGSADQVVSAPASGATAARLAAKGNDITFRLYPGADHSGVLAAALPDILAWAADRMR